MALSEMYRRKPHFPNFLFNIMRTAMKVGAKDRASEGDCARWEMGGRSCGIFRARNEGTIRICGSDGGIVGT